MLQPVKSNRNFWDRDQRGSFMVAGALFMIVFLLVAGMGVDVSRYLMQQDKLQSVADGAALAGARALNQFKNTPDESRAYEAVLDYVEETQGAEYRDLYSVKPDGDVDGIIVRNMDANGDGCNEGFTIKNDKINLSQRANIKTEILGSAITYGAGGAPIPVTTKVTVSDDDGNDTDMEPWGDFNDYQSGDVNTGGELDPLDMSDSPAGLELSVTARSHYPWGQEIMTVGSEDNLSLTVKDGDLPPGIDGFGDQGDAVEFVEKYRGPNGEVQLNDNQAIMFFELGATSGPAADYQDLVILVTMTPSDPPPGASGTGGSSASSQTNKWQESECSFGMAPYRVGVQVYDAFEPYFMPRKIFGDNPRAMMRRAVAEIQPTFRTKTSAFQPNCGVYAEQVMTINGNNLNAANSDFCGNADILASGSQNGSMGSLYHYGTVSEPGGGVDSTKKLAKKRTIPDFAEDQPGNYDVVINQGNYNSWPACGGGGPFGGGKALLTQSGDNVVWSGGGNVCVTFDGVGTFTVSGNNQGAIQNQDGSAVSMFSTGNVSFSGNGMDVNGGLYSEGDITVDGNNHSFTGDPSVMGGLALWAEGSLDILMNNIEMDGILGGEGNVTLGSMGGGTGPDFEGVVVSGGSFNFPSNSQNARIQHNKNRYDSAYLSDSDWSDDPEETQVSTPNFAHVEIRLLS